MKLFGFEILKSKEEVKQQETQKTFAVPISDDGATNIIAGGQHYGTYLDINGTAYNEVELITRYREMAMQPELENAINDIVNEAIVTDKKGHCVKINIDDLQYSDKIKDIIKNEFDYVLKLLNFNRSAYDIFRRWYIDGRMYFHVIIDDNNPKAGIRELRYIDPRKIRKIREIRKQRDSTTGVDLIAQTIEYYLFSDFGIQGATNLGSKISVDSVVNVTSGLIDARKNSVLSYLHKAIKPLNQLRMVEDATVIYRWTRAPERRIFYIDVGNMPTIKAKQYMKDIITEYRNKLVYDATTGEIRDDRKFQSIMDDFWLPRREGNRGTEISTLQGGQNLGQIEDVEYMEKKLYKALGIPYSRTQPQTGFSFGRVAEISRDEVNFSKFINRLRNRFSTLFDNLLKTQLVLKQVCSEAEWEVIQENLYYDFLEDNNFEELKESELNKERVGLVMMIDPFVGKYYTKEWVQKNVLRFNDEEIEEMEKKMKEEAEEAAKNLPTDAMGNPMDTDGYGNPLGDPEKMNNPELQQQNQQQEQERIEPSNPDRYLMSEDDLIALEDDDINENASRFIVEEDTIIRV